MEKFLKYLVQLPAYEFAGVATLMSVKLFEEDGNTPRAFENVFRDILDTFNSYDRARRRKVLKTVREAANASNT